MSINFLMIFALILLLASYGLTLCFKKRLGKKRFKELVMVESLPFTLILLTLLGLNWGHWSVSVIGSLVGILSIPFTIWAVMDFIINKLPEDK